MSDLPKPPEGMFWRVYDDYGIVVELRRKTFGPFSEWVEATFVDGPDYSVHDACNRILEIVRLQEQDRKLREDILNRYGGDNDRM